MSNKLVKRPSPIDTPVKCVLCGHTLYGPTGDMGSERGARFGQALHRHIAASHPDKAEAIIKMNDLFVSWCAYTLFIGDENYQEMIRGYRTGLLGIMGMSEPASESAEEPPPAPENTVQ